MRGIAISNNFIYKCFSVLFAIYLIIYPLNLGFVFSAINLLIYCIFLLIAWRYFRKPIKMSTGLLQLGLCVYVLFDAFIQQIELNIDNIQLLFCFEAMIILIGAHDSFHFDEKMHVFTRNIVLIVSLILSFYTLFPFAYYYRGTTKTCIYLTLNLDNSNFTGIVLFLLFSILWIEREKVKNKLMKVFQYGVMAYLVYMIYLSNSRTCLATCFIIVVYSVLFVSRKIPKWVLIATEIIPFFFVTFYLWLDRTYNSVLIMGKELFSGREDSYAEYLALMTKKPQILFGNMKEIFFTNAGNGPFAVFLATGVIGCLLFYVLYISQIVKLNSQCTSKTGRCAIVCFLAIAIHTCAEASMVLGGIVTLYFHFTLFCLAKSE